MECTHCDKQAEWMCGNTPICTRCWETIGAGLSGYRRDAMKVTSQGGFCIVTISSEDTNKFNRLWPCSPIPYGARFQIELSTRNGDLVNIVMWAEDGELLDSAKYDGDALLALTNDANNIAVSGGHLPQWARR